MAWKFLQFKRRSVVDDGVWEFNPATLGSVAASEDLHMRSICCLSGLVYALVATCSAQAESQVEQPSIEALMKKIDALQRRLDEVEGRQREARLSTTAAHRTATARPMSNVQPVVPQPPPTAAVQQAAAPIPGLLPPEPMGAYYEDALRSDLPGLSIRIPGTASEVRFYGFAKASGYSDFGPRNQNHAPAPQAIPLAGSAAAMQGGDMGMTARFSRIGLDTRTLTGLGTLETRIEGDFGGGPAASNNFLFRLRQAWGELGTESFRVLVGQANSLWNEGMFETLNDSTNLNQSFLRQTQIRFTGQLTPAFTWQAALEMPETQFTSAAGIFTPETNLGGGLSPAFSSVPDLLGRLTYRANGLELDTRGLLRDLNIRTAGTAAAPPISDEHTLGWGVATHARIPMRWLSEAFGPDQLIGMVYYGQGMGRYFAGNSFGQDLLSNIGLPSANIALVQDALPAYGATVAYRRFWTPQLRTNIAYSYARQEYPSYALEFTPGSASATFLNSQMQQGIVNLIWSPFATLRNGTVDTGWLDTGLEYIYTQREVFGGTAATVPVGAGYGVANRLWASATVRF
jgi:hypothetical protein